MSDPKLFISCGELRAASQVVFRLSVGTYQINRHLEAVWGSLDAGWDVQAGVDLSGNYNGVKAELAGTTRRLVQTITALATTANLIESADQTARTLYDDLLAVSDPAQVIAADGLYMRTAPTTNNDVGAPLIVMGTQNELLVVQQGGMLQVHRGVRPEIADGYIWYYVTYTDGDGNVYEGWIAGAMEVGDPLLRGVRYPDVGETVSLTAVPYDASVTPDYNHGFGNNLFAQNATNKCDWYQGTSGLHNGLDFYIPYDTALYWSGDIEARVVSINGGPNNYGAGAYSITLEAGGFIFHYGHTSDQAFQVLGADGEMRDLQVGDVIQPGGQVGYSGNPGGEAGAGNDHLHFETRPVANTGIAINPLGFFSGDLHADLSGSVSYDYSGGDEPESLGFYPMRVIACPVNAE